MAGKPDDSARTGATDTAAREQAETARRAAVAGARGPPPTDEEFARIQAEATARAAAPAPGPSSISSRLPAAARAVVAGARYVLNPSIWAADLAKFRRKGFERREWLAAVHKVTKAQRVSGDVLAPCIARVAEAIEVRDSNRDGMVQISHRDIEWLVNCCTENVRKSIRWLEIAGLIDTFNVWDRVAGKNFLVANAYVLRMPGEPKVTVEALQSAVSSQAAPPPETTVPDPATPAPSTPLLAAVRRATESMERWATAFGLAPRDFGLNATSLAAGRRPPPEASPAPA